MREHVWTMANAYRKFGSAMAKETATTALTNIAVKLKHFQQIFSQLIKMFVSAQNEPNTLCKSNEIACKDQTQCVLKSFLCDKEFDCNDRSDEIGCGKLLEK